MASIHEIMPWENPEIWQRIRAVTIPAWISGHENIFTEEEIERVKAMKENELFVTSWPIPKTARTFVAAAGGNLIGVAQMRPQVPTAHGEYALVEPMMVLPGQQRKGTGQSLWAVMAAASKQRGDKGMTVWALDRNPKAMNFYGTKLRLRTVGKGEFRLGDRIEATTEFRYDH